MGVAESRKDDEQTQGKILVVEDDKEVRDLMKELVARLGYAPLEAQNAKDALSHLEKERVDLMLLDLRMSGASGLDLLKLLNRREMQVPTIVVSAYVSPTTAKALLQLGVRGIVAKPFKVDRVLEEVEKVLQESGDEGDEDAAKCPKCSAAVDPDDNFCRRCGQNLTSDSP
jgi:DNA-binding NtrC family response regulator